MNLRGVELIKRDWVETAPDRGFVDAEADHDEHRSNERVGRDGEYLSRFLHAPEVADGDNGYEKQRDRNTVGVELRKHGVQGSRSGGDRNGHDQDVIEQKRNACDLSREHPEIVLRNDVGTAG